MIKVNENIDLFTEMYAKGISNKEIGDVFGIKPNTVCYWVKKLGLKMKGSGKRNYYHNPFLKESPERNYWLGYIFADGHIQHGVIDLYSTDKDVIDSYYNFIGQIGSITTENYSVNSGETHTIYKAHIYSVELSDWFMKTFNVLSTKHHNLNPNISINWDVFKGFFDGDGSAHKKGGLTITTSSIVWINRLSQFLYDEVGVTPIINTYKECYKLCVWKNEDLKKIIPKMYQHNTFCLNRKN